MFKDSQELITTLPDDKTCRKYLEQQRWQNGITCPFCGHNKCYVIKNGERYKCTYKTCFKRFTVTVGTSYFPKRSTRRKIPWHSTILLIRNMAFLRKYMAIETMANTKKSSAKPKEKRAEKCNGTLKTNPTFGGLMKELTDPVPKKG